MSDTRTVPPTIDFTEGCWGHCLHARTWRLAINLKPLTLGERIAETLGIKLRRHQEPQRFQVLVHSRTRPSKGYRIKYRSENGISQAEVLECESMGDPGDMYSLTVRVLS